MRTSVSRHGSGERDNGAIERAAPELAAIAQVCKLSAHSSDVRSARPYGPAVRATELLGKHIGMWSTRTDLSGASALSDLIARSLRCDVG